MSRNKEYEYRTVEQALQGLCDMFGLKKDTGGNYFRRGEDKPNAASCMIMKDKRFLYRQETL